MRSCEQTSAGDWPIEFEVVRASTEVTRYCELVVGGSGDGLPGRHKRVASITASRGHSALGDAPC